MGAGEEVAWDTPPPNSLLAPSRQDTRAVGGGIHSQSGLLCRGSCLRLQRQAPQDGRLQEAVLGLQRVCLGGPFLTPSC